MGSEEWYSIQDLIKVIFEPEKTALLQLYLVVNFVTDETKEDLKILLGYDLQQLHKYQRYILLLGFVLL
jgi:hypothetical protein